MERCKKLNEDDGEMLHDEYTLHEELEFMEDMIALLNKRLARLVRKYDPFKELDKLEGEET